MATEDLEEMVSEVDPAAGWAEPQLMEQYRAFGRECRERISWLVMSGAYPNLCSNKLRHTPVEKSGKARVNIIGRPGMQHMGTRSLNVGDSEIVFVVHAPLICPDDYTGGFLLPERQGWLRIVAGNSLVSEAIREATGLDITVIMQYKAKMQRTELFTCLSQGDYSGFVKNVVGVADSAVNELMAEYRSNRLS